MRKPLLTFSMLCLGLGLMAIPSFADHDKDRDDHQRLEHRDRDRHRDHHRDWDRDHGRDHHSAEHREHHYRRTHGDPPGWEHGEKKGWRDCDLPPGQAKKHGCEDRDHDDRYHHAEHRTANVPVLKPHAEEHRSPASTTVPVLKPKPAVHSNNDIVPVLKPHAQVHPTSSTTVPVLKPRAQSGARPEVQ
jgi:hypothetical protein